MNLFKEYDKLTIKTKIALSYFALMISYKFMYFLFEFIVIAIKMAAVVILFEFGFKFILLMLKHLFGDFNINWMLESVRLSNLDFASKSIEHELHDELNDNSKATNHDTLINCKGQFIMLVGILPITHQKAKQLIQECGGSISTQLTPKTTLLIAGKNIRNRLVLKKAKHNNVRIIECSVTLKFTY